MIDYKLEYERMHQEKRFTGTTILKYKEKIKEIFEKHRVKTMLDIGCGNAEAYTQHNLTEYLGINLIMLHDPYVKQFSGLNNLKHDAVVCIDTLEHVPEEELALLMNKIFDRALKCVIFTFCNRLAKKTFSNGTNIHITLKSESEWLKLIKTFNINKIPMYLWETK